MWCNPGFHTRPWLFLILVNYLKKLTKVLNPTMFADDTNLFYTNRKVLLEPVNKELHYISEWFLAIKLSLNAVKYLYFQK